MLIKITRLYEEAIATIISLRNKGIQAKIIKASDGFYEIRKVSAT